MKRFALFSLLAAIFAVAAAMPADSVLRRQAAAMLMVGFKGDSADASSDVARYVRDLGVRCVVLFDVDLTGSATIGSRNVTSVARLHALTDSIRRFSALPVLIAADQEGGRVARLKPQYGFEPTVSARAMGNSASEDTVRLYAGRMAADLARGGVNLNLAPVVDLHSDLCPVIGRLDRAFSSDPEAVARCAGWAIDEHHKCGIACTLKHFPGHGSATGDSHYGLVDVTDTWHESELVPFMRLIDADLADAIMTAHIYNRSVDPELPATLSAPILTGILRQRLGYDGVIITDDMYMDGVISRYDIAEALVLAINAGADLICVGNNIKTGFEPDRPFRLVDMIVDAVKAGKIAPERLASSEARVDALARKVQQ